MVNRKSLLTRPHSAALCCIPSSLGLGGPISPCLEAVPDPDLPFCPILSALVSVRQLGGAWRREVWEHRGQTSAPCAVLGDSQVLFACWRLSQAAAGALSMAPGMQEQAVPPAGHLFSNSSQPQGNLCC